jgi:rod shape-determining protein MreC
MLSVVLSITLIVVDVRFQHLDHARHWLSSAFTPMQWLGDLPFRLSNGIAFLFTSREALEDELESMRAKVLVLERKSQKLASMTAEMNRLRELLKASRVVDDDVVVTELSGVSPDVDNQYIVIDKGISDGVYRGQAVLDDNGLMGQVIELSEFTSRVLLISDGRHAVPVQVNRNGVRAIAYGVGSMGRLELGNVPDTADIQVGDLLVSSGLGGRFPQGYPVATVSSIEHDPGYSFARVEVRPKAKLNESSLLLLVFQDGKGLQSQSTDSERDEVALRLNDAAPSNERSGEVATKEISP